MIETVEEQKITPERPAWRRRLGLAGEALLDLTGFGGVNWIKAYSKGKLGPRKGALKLLVGQQTILTLASRGLTLFNTECFCQGDFVTPFIPVIAYGVIQGLERKVLEHTLPSQTAKGS